MMTRRFYIPQLDADGKTVPLSQGDTVLWNQQHFDSKRKPKRIWTHYEVGIPVNFSGVERSVSRNGILRMVI